MPERIQIFLIEDDADDIELLEVSLKDNNVQYKMDVVTEGDKVQEYLKNCERLPHIIVMDLNLIIKQIKANEEFRNFPLIVLTTSTAKEDIEYSCNMGADSFITKPTTIQGFNATVGTIVQLASN
ncbi:MAG: response regulator [Chitinophagaceae bacterium]|nr:response regulator [Chitinophagaceae bacterium]